MPTSAKWGWSAAAGMTFVSAILAGMLWGRSQTTPTAEAHSIEDLLRSLPEIKYQDHQAAADRALTQQQEVAELAEIRERLNIRLFENPTWNEGTVPQVPAPEKHSDDLPQDEAPLDEAVLNFSFFGSFSR